MAAQTRHNLPPFENSRAHHKAALLSLHRNGGRSRSLQIHNNARRVDIRNHAARNFLFPRPSVGVKPPARRQHPPPPPVNTIPTHPPPLQPAPPPPCPHAQPHTPPPT